MCGLVGVIGDINEAEKRMFDYMLKLDTIRGPHSTGIARIHTNKRDTLDIVKGVGTAWQMINDKNKEYYAGGTKGMNGNYIALMGHNRWATVGGVKEENAHPFNAGKIVGAQNGTIPDFYRKKLDDWYFYETDTEALMFNIDLNGVEATLGKLIGAWALTFYNFEDDTFNIIRNPDRPLYYAWKKNGKTLYYASEPEFIYMAADKMNIDIQEDTAYSFSTDTLYTFKLGERGKFGKHVLTTKIVKGYEHPKVVHTTTTNHTVTGGNVFSNKNFSQNSSIYTAGYWAGKKDEPVEFTVLDGLLKDSEGKEYIRGFTVKGRSQIRIYPSIKRPDLFEFLGDREILTYYGYIRKVKMPANKDFYIVLDPKTIDSAMLRTATKQQSDLFEKYKKENKEEALPSPIYIWDDVKCQYVPRLSDRGKELAEKEEKALTAMKIAAGLDDDIPFDDKSYPVFDGRVCREYWERAVDCGCAWCSAIPDVKDADKVKWVTRDTYLCSECAGNEEVTKYVGQMYA